MDKPLVNRVASSGLITIKPESYLPTTPVATLDIKEYLFKELILREKDFRQAMKEHDWTQYAGQVLCVFCSSDAIIPVWAYMLVAVNAEPHATMVYQGEPEDYLREEMHRRLDAIDPEEFAGQRIVIKGCSDKPVPPAAYLELSRKLRPYVKSIMYGEPCSTVPIYKAPKPQ